VLNITFKELKKKDVELHKEFIYVALWDSPDETRRSRSVLSTPKVEAYYINWGQPNDVGLIAYYDGLAAGLIQLRVKESITKEYAEYPELAIAVLPQYQGRGIGNLMYSKLVSKVESQHSGIRLGVNPKNEVAIKLYKKLDFNFYAHPEGSYPQMVVKFDKMPNKKINKDT
jgi:ribosomal protein S18 acetylase RimI-like enzyme